LQAGFSWDLWTDHPPVLMCLPYAQEDRIVYADTLSSSSAKTKVSPKDSADRASFP